MAACVWFGADHARAESAVVLPHAGDTRLDPLREAAYRAVIDALREQGLNVRTLTPKSTRNADELKSDCTQVTCAPGVLSVHSIDLAVAIAVWNGEDGPQTNVTLIDSLGRKYPGYAIVLKDDAAAAGRAALLEARSLHLLGPGPWIHVRGAPAGASVLLDGKPVGVLPYRGALSPGDHDLEVRADGYNAKRQPIVIPLEPTTTARIELELQPTDKPGLARPTAAPPVTDDYVQEDPVHAAHDEASPWNFVIGGILAAGGVALATIQPIPDAIESGQCADAECKEEYHFGGESVLKVGVGALIAAAGVTFMIWQPLRIEAEVDHGSALVRATLQL
jgi:hypothetical protein